MPHQEIAAELGGEGKRLDVYLAKVLAGTLSRSQLQKLIKDGKVIMNGREVAAHARIKNGDLIRIEWEGGEEPCARAEDIPLEIVYEDEDLLVVNKPAGMVVHPAHGNIRHTLVNALLAHTSRLSDLGGPERPGIVHRLDMDTSGLLVVAKTNHAHAVLARQFKKHSIERVYLACVRGVVQHDESMCEEPVGRSFLSRKKVMVKPAGGKQAATFFRVLRRFKNSTLLEVRPRTGRTHQIRVHLAHVGHPVFGDSFYGIASPWIKRQALHASKLGFLHPRTKEKMLFESPLPEDMQHLLACLESEG